MKRIGILTGGGDCPGLNCVIRAVAKTVMARYGATVVGIEDGFEGLVLGHGRELHQGDVSGIINLGGTILGTSNKGDPWHFPVTAPDRSITITDASAQAMAHYRDWKLDCLVAVGGDGTMNISSKLMGLGANVVGVPKTIDNDLAATDLTFGHETAVAVATEAIDRLHTTASSHHRVMVIEVMGRYAGWIALRAGVAGGADIILIPEIPFTWDAVFAKVLERSRRGKRFSIVCVAEGARLPDGGEVIKSFDQQRTDAKQLGGVGEQVAARITAGTGLETRVTVLGHLLRGGSPVPWDRVLATRFGVLAGQLAAEGRYGLMAALHGSVVEPVTMAAAIARLKLVTPDDELVGVARAVGTCFGEAG